MTEAGKAQAQLAAETAAGGPLGRLVLDLWQRTRIDWGFASDRLAEAFRRERRLRSDERRFASETLYGMIRHLHRVDEALAAGGLRPGGAAPDRERLLETRTQKRFDRRDLQQRGNFVRRDRRLGRGLGHRVRRGSLILLADAVQRAARGYINAAVRSDRRAVHQFALQPDAVQELHPFFSRLENTRNPRSDGVIDFSVGKQRTRERLVPPQFLLADLFDMAAAYLFHIVQNHPFQDGNKRVGAVAAIVFLLTNGQDIALTNDELEALVLKTATGKLKREEIAARLRGHRT